MKILIVRHADPNYDIDGLTEVGQREAELLSERLCREDICDAYCSIFGRARLTAKPTLQKLGIEAKYCDWLREFEYAKVGIPRGKGFDAAWDMLPSYMSENPQLYDPNRWFEAELIKNTEVYRHYKNVCSEFDKVLALHGYERSGVNYIAKKPCHDTVAFFCHYGVASVILSHIMNCSPYTLWQNAVLLPSSVTTVYTEERREGVASLRVCGMGDLSHLYAGGAEPSFAARFCECFADDTRHD